MDDTGGGLEKSDIVDIYKESSISVYIISVSVSWERSEFEIGFWFMIYCHGLVYVWDTSTTLRELTDLHQIWHSIPRCICEYHRRPQWTFTYSPSSSHRSMTDTSGISYRTRLPSKLPSSHQRSHLSTVRHKNLQNVQQCKYWRDEHYLLYGNYP